MLTHHIVNSHSGNPEWLFRYLLPCPFKKLTGLDCPGCGFQRSVIALLHGNMAQSFTLYPATLLMISTILWIMVNQKSRYANYYFVKRSLLIATAIVIGGSYIVKIAGLHITY